VVLRPGADLEIRLEVQQALVDRDAALAVVDRIRRIGVRERAAREHLALRRAGRGWRDFLGGDDVGEEDVRIGEDAERHASRDAEHRADREADEDRLH
jgi:hypothetical protein